MQVGVQAYSVIRNKNNFIQTEVRTYDILYQKNTYRNTDETGTKFQHVAEIQNHSRRKDGTSNKKLRKTGEE